MYCAVLIFLSSLILCQLPKFLLITFDTPTIPNTIFCSISHIIRRISQVFYTVILLSLPSAITDHKAETYLSTPFISLSSTSPYFPWCKFLSQPDKSPSFLLQLLLASYKNQPNKSNPHPFHHLPVQYLSLATWWPWQFNVLFLQAESLLQIPPHPLPAFTETKRTLMSSNVCKGLACKSSWNEPWRFFKLATIRTSLEFMVQQAFRFHKLVRFPVFEILLSHKPCL